MGYDSFQQRMQRGTRVALQQGSPGRPSEISGKTQVQKAQ